MTKTSDEKSSKLKPYQMILLSCLLAAFMIINSNNVNYNRDLAKLNKEKGELFDRIIKTRRLSSSSSQTYSAEICERGSDDLKEYYQKGDPKIIDIDPNESIKCEDKDETYMKALINIVRTMADDTEEDPDGGRRNLRNLGGVSDIDQQDLTDYGMRFLPMAVFLVFGILSIFGWIFCCICCCCDCCCCCCLKKTSCKVPCFIFTYVFYGLVVGISLYGLIQSNKIFVSLSDTECSILKFFEQVLNGEIKQSLPRWAGIHDIQGLLTSIETTVRGMGSPVLNQLNTKMGTLENDRSTFDGTMKSAGKELFYDGTSPYAIKSDYKESFTEADPYLDGNYVYDVVYNFGRYSEEEGKFIPRHSYLEAWYQEFSIVDGEAYRHLQTAESGFTDILGNDGLGRVESSLREGREKLDELTGPFSDANDEIGKIFSNVSESIDEYGKLSVKVIFGALMAMNVALAALMLLICMFSGKSCTSCCCCRCLFKFCTHILWNVLALLMILSFIIGSLIAFLGRFGGDVMGIVSYIMSRENFDDPNSLILNRLNDAKEYLKECIHENGDIASLLHLENSLTGFNNINDAESDILAAKNNFSITMEETPSYFVIKNLLEKQNNYTTEAFMIPENGITDTKKSLSNKDLLNNYLNTNLPDNVRKWDLNSPNEYECGNTPEGESFYPIKCKPYNSPYTSSTGYPNFNKYAGIYEKIDKIIIYANDGSTSTSTQNNVMKVINGLRSSYIGYLRNYVDILDFFYQKIHSITSIVSQYSDPQNLFSFLNGRFIGINLQIILKYLKHSLGGDFFTVGICLCVVGLSLILSISSTIILIVIINIGLKEAIEQNKMINNPGIAVSQFEGVPNLPKPPY